MVSIIGFGSILIVVYSNDHDPVHCHVLIEKETNLKVYLPDLKVSLVKGKMPRPRQIQEIRDFVWKHRNEIGKKWREFHGN